MKFKRNKIIMYLTKIRFSLIDKLGKTQMTERSVLKKKSYKKFSENKNMQKKIDEATIYGGYGDVHNNDSDCISFNSILKQACHLFIVITSNNTLDKTSTIDDIDEGMIANAKTPGKFLKTLHYGKDDILYECKNEIKSNLTVFEDITNFKKKKIKLKDLEKVELIKLKKNSNLKTKVFDDLGNDEFEIKETLKLKAKYVDLD